MGPPDVPYQPYTSLHRESQGPGDARPTARQILEDFNVIGNLSNKYILITGASSGIGIVTATALYKTGAQLYLAARDLSKLQQVIDNITAKQKSTSSASYSRTKPIEMHLDSFSSVRQAATTIRDHTQTLSIIVCNADVVFVPHTLTEDGFESHLGINHLAYFLLYQELKQLLVQGARLSKSTSRVIRVSSSGYRSSGIDFDDMNSDRKQYDVAAAYGQSKTANIYMAITLSRMYLQDGIIGLSLHPCVIVETDIRRHMSEEAMYNLHS